MAVFAFILVTLSDAPSILENDTLDAQVGAYMEKYGLSEEDIRERMGVLSTIVEHFKDEFPNVSAVPFGSTFTRLGIRGCDLDVHMDLGK